MTSYGKTCFFEGRTYYGDENSFEQCPPSPTGTLLALLVAPTNLPNEDIAMLMALMSDSWLFVPARAKAILFGSNRPILSSGQQTIVGGRRF